MKLTCVTATYNVLKAGNRDALVRCIRSVSQLKTPHEHLIYDGASIDGTVDVIRELAKSVPGVAVVSEKDRGVYNALNKGLKAAAGEWFYVLGSDDAIVDPQCFDSLLASVDSETELIIAPTIRGEGNSLFRKISELGTLLQQFPYSHQSVIMRTSVLKDCGGFDESYKLVADWDMLMKCYRAERRFWYTERPIAYYAPGGLSESLPCAGQEQNAVYSKFWGLVGWRRRLFEATNYVPIGKILALRHHADPVIRMSVKPTIWQWVKSVFRIVFWPVIVVRRRRFAQRSRDCKAW